MHSKIIEIYEIITFLGILLKLLHYIMKLIDKKQILIIEFKNIINKLIQFEKELIFIENDDNNNENIVISLQSTTNRVFGISIDEIIDYDLLNGIEL